MTALARVREVWVFPVKSMAGVQVDSAAVEPGGLVGDRSWAVVDASGATVTAKEAPQLRDVVPHLVEGEVRLDVPGSPAGLDVDAAGPALSSFLGRVVRLAHRPGTGFVDVAPVHVVSTAAMADAAHAEHDNECDACSASAPRANLVVQLEEPGSERDWVGRDLRVGGAALHVVRLPKHCLGAYADVTTPGSLHVGDDVTGA